MIKTTSNDIASILTSKREELFSSAERQETNIEAKKNDMHFSSVDKAKERVSSGGRIESIIESPVTMMKRSPKLQEKTGAEISFEEQ